MDQGSAFKPGQVVRKVWDGARGVVVREELGRFRVSWETCGFKPAHEDVHQADQLVLEEDWVERSPRP